MRADFSRRRHRVEHACHDLRRTRPRAVVGKLCFEEFGVGKNDPELIVQAMEQEPEVGRFVHRRPRSSRIGGRVHEASLLVSSCVRPGSRQSVSTKMRTDPPAVRTYSTLPLAIQL